MTSNTYRSSSSAASLKGCCCCIVLLFSFLALLSLAIILIIVLAIKPKKPQFDLQQVTIQYINFATTTTNTFDPLSNTESISLVLLMLFTVKNDNIAGIKYTDSSFSIMYRGVPLGRGVVPGFYQDAHSVKHVKTTVKVDRVNLLQSDADDLVKDVSVNDRVELRVFGDVNAKIRIIGITSPNVQIVELHKDPSINPSKQNYINLVTLSYCWVLWKIRNDCIFLDKKPSLRYAMKEVKGTSFLWLTNRSTLPDIVWSQWNNFNF